MDTKFSKTGCMLKAVIRDSFPFHDSNFDVYCDDPGNDWDGYLNYCVISLKSYCGIDLELINDFKENLENHGYICTNIYFDPMRKIDGDSFAPYLEIVFNLSTNLYERQ